MCLLLWFQSRLFPRGACVEGLVLPPCINVQRCDFGKGSDHENSKIMDGQIYWWIPRLVDYWEAVANGRKWDLTEGSGSLGSCSWRLPCPQHTPLFLFPSFPEVSSFDPLYPPCHDAVDLRSKAMEPLTLA